MPIPGIDGKEDSRLKMLPGDGFSFEGTCKAKVLQTVEPMETGSGGMTPFQVMYEPSEGTCPLFVTAALTQEADSPTSKASMHCEMFHAAYRDAVGQNQDPGIVYKDVLAKAKAEVFGNDEKYPECPMERYDETLAAIKAAIKAARATSGEE